MPRAAWSSQRTSFSVGPYLAPILGGPDGFLLSIQPEHGGSRLWICDDVTGDPEQVIQFVLRCAEAFDLTGRWGFQFANTCSRPRVNAFGGGAHVLVLGTRKTIAWSDTNGWLALKLDE